MKWKIENCLLLIATPLSIFNFQLSAFPFPNVLLFSHIKPATMKTNITSLWSAALAVVFLTYSCSQAPKPPAAGEGAALATEMPSVQEQNKKLAMDLLEAFNARQFDKAAAFFSDDYVYHPVDSVRGPQKAVAYIKGFADVFDAKLQPLHLTAEGDLVSYHLSVTGRHIAPMGNVPPTNKDINVESMGIFRMKDGKIAEEWEIFQEGK